MLSLQKQKTFPKKKRSPFLEYKKQIHQKANRLFLQYGNYFGFHVSCNHSVQSMLVQNEGYNGLQELEGPDEIKRAKTSVSVRYGTYTIVMDIRTTVECNAVVMSLFMVIVSVFVVCYPTTEERSPGNVFCFCSNGHTGVFFMGGEISDLHQLLKFPRWRFTLKRASSGWDFK